MCLIPVKQKDLKAWAREYLLTQQHGLCPLCRTTIDHMNPKDMVVDHDHKTGEIRGVLHRSCNAGEGKIMGAVARWGVGAGAKLPDCIRWLENLLSYLKKQHTGRMYPGAKTEEEREEAARLSRNKLAAQRRATAKLRGS